MIEKKGFEGAVLACIVVVERSFALLSIIAYCYNESMVFFFGLGNPGAPYQNTRHNAGQFVLRDLLRLVGDIQLSALKKTEASVAKTPTAIFAESLLFMNESGKSIRSVIEYFDKDFQAGDSLDAVYVIHDDLDLELGQYKIQFGTGPKIHNGLLSTYQYLKTMNFWHVRVGVDTRNGDRSLPAANYVLQHFSETELQKMRTTSVVIAQELKNRTAI